MVTTSPAPRTPRVASAERWAKALERAIAQGVEDYRFCLACAALAEPWDRFCADCGACLGDPYDDDDPADWNRCPACDDRIAHGVAHCGPCQAAVDVEQRALAEPAPLAA